MFKDLKETIEAYKARDPAARSRLEVRLCYPGLSALKAHRMAHTLFTHGHILLARWLSQPDVQVRWQKAVGDLPARQAAWKDPSLADDPFLSVFGKQLEDTKAPPALLTWTQVSSQSDKALEQIVRAGADPATVMKDLQGQADSIGTGRK